MQTRLYATMPRNLQKGIFKQKSQKYAFDRKNGKMVDNRDRQWILRLYYCMKQEDHYLNLDDSEVLTQIVEWSGCSPKTVESIISSGTVDVEDQCGHPMQKKIVPRKEERIMEESVKKIQENLDQGIPINAKDIRGWLREVHKINLAKTTMLDYLKKWGLGWKRLKHSEYRKERAYVMAQREEFLEEIQKELSISNVRCGHRDLCGCPK